MARVKISKIGQGQHPSELMISVNTQSGKETLIVDQRSVQGDSIDVGYPVGGDDEFLLVELPRETMSGQWRVLVPGLVC
jgi:hypothetical protein